MDVAIRSAFWIVTFGGIGLALFKVVKPDDELIQKIEKDYRQTDSRRQSIETIKILKQAADQNSDLNKKLEDLLKK